MAHQVEYSDCCHAPVEVVKHNSFKYLEPPWWDEVCSQCGKKDPGVIKAEDVLEDELAEEG